MGRELVELGLRMLDTIDRELAPLDRALHTYARRQPGCRALITRLYGVGAVTATAVLAELGDTRRFTSADDAVRHAFFAKKERAEPVGFSYSCEGSERRTPRPFELLRELAGAALAVRCGRRGVV